MVSLSGVVKPLAAKGLIERAAPSPDGQYSLVATVHRPFSYTFPYERFPLKTEVVPVKGTGAVKLLSDRGAVDNLPISRDAVEPGPRDTSGARTFRRQWFGLRLRMAGTRRSMLRSSIR